MDTTHKKAFDYYLKGLNSKEIAKLMEVSFRTVQNWMHQQNWKAKRKKHLEKPKQ